MSENKKQGGPGDTVELADKDTGFYDPATQLKLVREQTAVIGDTVGKATQTALLSGQLLVVSGKKKKAADSTEGGSNEPPDDLDIPQDLPGREAFVAAGYTTFQSIKDLDNEEKLLAVKGIGKGTVKALQAWAAATQEDK